MSRDSLGKSAPEIRDEWKTKHQIDLSTEDLKKYRIGTSTNAVPIFFDLRPITELLSPVYFEFNPDHPVQQFAPFIWFNLRDELDDFLLTEVGLNDQISKNAAGFLDDLSPHRIHVSVSSVKAVIPADKYGNFAVDLYSAVLKVGISVQTFASTDPDFVKYGREPGICHRDRAARRRRIACAGEQYRKTDVFCATGTFFGSRSKSKLFKQIDYRGIREF